MRMAEIAERGDRARERIAYLRIAKGLTIKECADILDMNIKTAEYHWDCAKRIIQGRPSPWEQYRSVS